MQIPLIEFLPGPDRLIPLNGRNVASWYKTGLYNVLLHFKPKKCLEIGTRFGGTARVFNHYFAHHQDAGTLVTCDIAKFRDLGYRRVMQVLVPPHDADVARQDLFFRPERMMAGWESLACDSVAHTSEKLRQYAPFDFVYVDGDHTYEGVSKDWAIVRNVAPNGTPVVFDDVMGQHEHVARFYGEICVGREHYEFGDWPVTVGIGVVTL